VRDAFAGDQSQTKFTTAAPHQQFEANRGRMGLFTTALCLPPGTTRQVARGYKSWIMLLSPLKSIHSPPLVDKQLVHLIMIP